MPSVSPVLPGTDCGHLPRSSVKGKSWEVNVLQKQLIGFHSKQCTQASVLCPRMWTDRTTSPCCSYFTPVSVSMTCVMHGSTHYQEWSLYNHMAHAIKWTEITQSEVYMNKHIDVYHTQCIGHAPIILLKIIILFYYNMKLNTVVFMIGLSLNISKLVSFAELISTKVWRCFLLYFTCFLLSWAFNQKHRPC